MSHPDAALTPWYKHRLSLVLPHVVATLSRGQRFNLCGGLFDERVADSLVAAFVVESFDNITQIDMRSAVIDAEGLRSLYTGWRK